MHSKTFKQILFSISLFISGYTMACDICNVFEYANRRNRSYIGVFYRQRFFNGYADIGQQNQYYVNPQPLHSANAREAHVPEGEGTAFYRNKSDYEMYQTVELRGNYAFKKNWNFQVIIPYVHSQLYYKTVWPSGYPIQDSTININGFGDIVVMGDYTHSFQTGKFKHLLKPGIGIKIPTGMYTSGANGKTYGYDIQPGTSSYDVIARLNYLITNDKWGADLFLNYRYCTEGKNQIQFGNKWNAMANVYYTFKFGDFSLMPKAGGYYEFSEKDRFKSQIKDLTGGYSWFYQGGFDVMYKQAIVQFLFQKPISEKLNGPVIGNAGRLMVGMVYNFD